jgi:hypothetical protein
MTRFELISHVEPRRKLPDLKKPACTSYKLGFHLYGKLPDVDPCSPGELNV